MRTIGRPPQLLEYPARISKQNQSINMNIHANHALWTLWLQMDGSGKFSLILSIRNQATEYSLLYCSSGLKESREGHRKNWPSDFSKLQKRRNR
jgi:hypothetical protein